MSGPGSLWPAVKTACLEAWEGLPGLAGVSLLYTDPLVAADVNGDAGLRESVWWEGAATGQLSVVELGTPVIVDEQLEAALIVQVLGSDTADTAEVVEARAAEIVGALVDHIAANPRVAVPDGWSDVVVTLQGSITWVALPNPRGGARCRIQVRVEGSRC